MKITKIIDLFIMDKLNLTVTITERVKWIALTFLILMTANVAYSQVGINMTNAPADGSAMLDVQSSSKGVLLTPMLGASRDNILNPATGLTVFITDDATYPHGYYYYNGTAWVKISDASSSIPSSSIINTVATLAASGTTIATTSQISSDITRVTISGSLNIAVRLPDAVVGKRVYVDNVSTNGWPVIVFPSVIGGTISGMPASSAWTIPIGTSMEFLATASGGATDVWVPSNEISPVNGVASANKVLTTGITGIPQWSSAASGNQIFYSNAAGLPGWLAAPNANQFLYSNSSSAPSWLTAPTSNQFLYANVSGVPSWLAAPAANQALFSNGSAAPGWGTLPVSAGGTGATSLTGYIKGNGTSAFTASSTIPVADIAGSFSANNLTGVVPITNGGTGQITKTAAFDALSPMTTLGDMVYFDGTNNVRLAGITTSTKKYLRSAGTGTFATNPSWVTIDGADIGGPGAVPTIAGGTGTTASGNQYGIPYYTLTNKMASTLAGSTTTVLHGNNIGAPTWSTVLLTNDVSGTLPVGNGGTGATTLTGIVKGTGTTAFVAATVGTDYSVGTSGLATGLLKSTTGTGALSIATGSDLPAGSANYISNTTTSQASANFNIGGTGAIGNGASNSFMLDVEGGTANLGVAGKGIQLVAQAGNSSLGGAFTIKAGSAGLGAAAGAVTITAGNGNSSSGGNISLTPGTGSSNGAVIVTQGLFQVSSTANGAITVGTCTTPAATISVSGTIQATGAITGGTTACGSDIRWKKDITPLSNSLDNILKLNGYYYYWKTKEFPDNNFSDDRQVGVIAQEVEKIYPELVITNKTTGYKYVDYAHLTAIIIEAMKEQQKMIDDLKTSNYELKAAAEKTKILEEQFTTLQAQMSELSNYIRLNSALDKEKASAIPETTK